MSIKRLGLVAATAIAVAGSTALADAKPGQGPVGRAGGMASSHFSAGPSNFSGSPRVSGQFSGTRISGGSYSGMNYGRNYNRNYSYSRRGRGWGGYGVGLGVATGLALGAGYGYGYYDDPYYAAYDDDGYYGGYAAYGAGDCWIQRRAVIDEFGYRRIRRVRVCE
jgi:hypothetical protein